MASNVCGFSFRPSKKPQHTDKASIDCIAEAAAVFIQLIFLFYCFSSYSSLLNCYWLLLVVADSSYFLFFLLLRLMLSVLLLMPIHSVHSVYEFYSQFVIIIFFNFYSPLNVLQQIAHTVRALCKYRLLH